MRQFLDQLYTTGQVTVPGAGVPFAPEGAIYEEIFLFDRSARLGISGQAPELDLTVAEWAARLLAEAARLGVARELGETHIADVFAHRCPRPRSAEVDYSADLFLRYVPDLLLWVQRLASEDPLVERLRRLSAEWPLSSVGVKQLTPGSIEPFVGHPALRQLYVDRIVATGDVSRLNDPRVAEAVRAALGAHPDLSPNVAKALAPVAGVPE